MLAMVHTHTDAHVVLLLFMRVLVVEGSLRFPYHMFYSIV